MSVDLAAVRDAGGTVVPDGSGVTIRGWTVQTVKAPILRDADTDQFREELGKAKNTPEQLFADSRLVLRHEHTGIALSFTAKAALQAWQAAKLYHLTMTDAGHTQQTMQAAWTQTAVLMHLK
ncbi:hypothetical protein WJX82_008662 [Trebouxia sp. C0006]